MAPPQFRPLLLALSLTLLATAVTAATQAVGQQQREEKNAPPQRPPIALPRPTVAPNPPRPSLLPPADYLPVSKLKAGMKGYGLTVFKGNKVERFEVTILGVMRKVNYGRDWILVKLGGPSMQRVTDVIAGMSGSPVYVNGKIVGAVAYGSQFTRESIGYLTPIEDMVDAWDPALHPPRETGDPGKGGAVSRGSIPLPQPLQVDGRQYTSVAVLPPGQVAPQGTLALRPLGAKVTVSGVPRSRQARVAEVLGRLGAEARFGTGGGASALPRPDLKGSPLVPGGAVGVSLATGDIDMTAIGTLTYRRGKQVVAFGHPFLGDGIGPIDAPMYTAYIHDIEPSFAESHKIGSAVSLVGAVSQDRPFAIGGRIGSPPAMVPISVRVNDRATRRDRHFEAKLVRHPLLTPQLAPLAASTAIAEVHGQPGDAMATVTTTVVADEVGTITRSNRVYAPLAIDSAATADLDSLMGLLSGNPFYPLAVRSVKMEVNIDAGRRTAQVERIFLRQTQYEPGDTVEVSVVLKPYKQERVTKTLKLRIPASVSPGTLLLSVQGGSGGGGGMIGLNGMMLGRLGGGTDSSGVATVKQLVRRYQERERNDELVARLMLPTAAVNVAGEKLSDLPPHIEAALRGGASPRSSSIRLERDEVKVTEPTSFVLSGAQGLPIRVVRKGFVDPSRPTFGGDAVMPPPGIERPGEANPGAAPPGSTPPAGGGVPAPSTFGGGGPEEGEEDRVSVLPATLQIPIPARPPAGSPAGSAVPAGEQPTRPVTVSPDTARPVADTAASGAPRPVGRMPGIWKLGLGGTGPAADFRAATLDGVTITSTGEVRLAPKLTRVAESLEPFFWSLAPDGEGGVFVGSGDNGVVYRVGKDGKLTSFASTGELEVHALARGKDGTLYAGTSPKGRVFRIGADGKPSLLFEAKDARFIFTLTIDAAEGTLYVGAGGPKARVYSIPLGSGGGVFETLYESDEGSITALALGPEGALYAGTSPGGLVLQLASGEPRQKGRVVYDAAEAAITGLAVDKADVVYAATAGARGVLYRLAPGMTARPLYDRPSGAGMLMGLQLSPEGRTLYTGTGQTVVAVGTAEGETARTFDAPSDIQILSLLLSPEGKLWASTGNVGGVYTLASAAAPSTEGAAALAEGSLTSPVFDARATAAWGTARATAAAPPGTRVYLQTRSGDTGDPEDGTWSPWSRALAAAPGGERIVSPPGRYLQWRATLAREGKDTAEAEPALRGVEVYYRTPNQAPQVGILSPRGGEVWRGKQTVRWAGIDPDRDALAFDVYVSGDGGKTWQPLKGSIPSAPTSRPAAPALVSPPATSPALAEKQAAEQRMLAQIQDELEKHPEISPEMRARILADAPRQLREAVNSPSAPPSLPGTGAAAVPAGGGAGLRETSLPLDTARFEDGVYLVKVVATDRPANPEGAREEEKVSGEFRIVNRPPLLVPLERGLTVRPDNTVRLEGVAMHRNALIRAVQFRVNADKDWTAATAGDGIFDGTLEGWSLTTATLSRGPHVVEVQAIDEAGNVATAKVTVKVP